MTESLTDTLVRLAQELVDAPEGPNTEFQMAALRLIHLVRRNDIEAELVVTHPPQEPSTAAEAV